MRAALVREMLLSIAEGFVLTAEQREAAMVAAEEERAACAAASYGEHPFAGGYRQ